MILHCRTLYINIRGRNTQKRQGRESDHTSRHLEREGTTHEREGEAERSILMTHNSLSCISVTDATFHEWRDWLKALAYMNTVHQYNENKHTKETTTERE